MDWNDDSNYSSFLLFGYLPCLTPTPHLILGGKGCRTEKVIKKEGNREGETERKKEREKERGERKKEREKEITMSKEMLN